MPLVIRHAARTPMIRGALLVAAALSIAPRTGAQSSAPAQRPTAAGADPSSVFMPERLARVDSMVERLIAERRIPGAVVMLVHDGRVVHHKAFGYRDNASNAPMRTDDIFRIASQTKAITSLAAMILFEEGKFRLDDPVSRYLPEFAKQQVLVKFNAADTTYEAKPVRRGSTIRQLLTHTSGLDYADIGSEDFRAIYAKAGITALGREGDVLAERVAALGKLPLAFEPGERFNYGLSVDVLGRLVEVWSGMPLDRFVRTRIFEPLQMRDTWFELPADRRSRLVTLHNAKDGVVSPTHVPEGGMHPDFPARRMTYFSGGGGLSSTTADYARFLQLFLNGGELDGVRIIGRKTVELMLTDQLPRLQSPFGLGFQLETPDNDHRSIVSDGTFSWSGAFGTYYWADPKERLVGQIYTSVNGLDFDLGSLFKVLVYASLR